MAGAGIAKRIPALLFLCPVYGVHHGALRALRLALILACFRGSAPGRR